MFEEKSTIEIITLEKPINLFGMNLQASSLPLKISSLGLMWDRYTDEIKKATPNRIADETEYGVCLNKVPDYLVAVEVSAIAEAGKGYLGFTVPTGKYLKITFNGEDHMDLVDTKFTKNQNAAKAWAKQNQVNLNGQFMVEVYPPSSRDLVSPEMYLLFPIK